MYPGNSPVYGAELFVENRLQPVQTLGLFVGWAPRLYKHEVYVQVRCVGHVVSAIEKSDLDQVLSRKRPRSS